MQETSQPLKIKVLNVHIKINIIIVDSRVVITQLISFFYICLILCLFKLSMFSQAFLMFILVATSYFYPKPIINLYLMIHKNSLKTMNQKPLNKANSNHNQPQNSFRHLLHYNSLQSMHLIPKEKQAKQIKQTKDFLPIKISHMPKRASQQEFKRFNSQANFICPQKSVLLDEEYEKKSKYRADLKDDKKSSIGSKGSRGSTENQYARPNNPLKETSSTLSAQTMGTTKKQAPAFLKCKSKTLLYKKILEGKFDREGFTIIKKLGQGKFGKVFMAKQITTGFILAMKVVQKRKVIADGLLDQFIKELKIQTFLKHPNIIEVFGFFEDQKYFYTLMQLGCDGQLYNLISEKKKLTQQGTSFITKNLLQAINHMHNLKVLHRDIKPQNIVRIMGNVKICDFGWATNKVTKQQLRSTYCGTPLYLSPEILKGHKYDQKVDLWAIGILAYQLLLGKSPFDICQHQDLYKIMTDQVKFPVQKKVSKQFQQFIINILNKNPKERLNSEELLSLKFIRKYQDLQTCQQLCQ